MSDLLQPGWTESTKAVNGVDLHVVEAGDPADPLLILLHGFPEFWWAWRKQITPLAAAGYHVIVPDMRGYNESSAPQEVAAYHLDILAADVVALADAYGADRFHLVGHDWGAIVTWWTAATHPARLRRVVVMDGPHPDVWGPQAIKHPTQALRSTYVALFQLPWAPEAALSAMDFAGLKAMMTGSAHPDTFDIRRTDLPRLHPIFGGGAHRCIGEALARIELEEGLGALMRLAPGLRLTGAMPVIQGHSGIRRIDALRVAA